MQVKKLQCTGGPHDSAWRASMQAVAKHACPVMPQLRLQAYGFARHVTQALERVDGGRVATAFLCTDPRMRTTKPAVTKCDPNQARVVTSGTPHLQARVCPGL